MNFLNIFSANIKNVVTGVTTLVDGKIPDIAYHISRATAHPEFFEGEPFNDIGIIRTLQTFVYTTSVRALPWSTSNLGANQQLTIIGWDLVNIYTYFNMRTYLINS